MATISGAAGEKIFSLKKFMGLNQAPDGDTKLKFGEAAEMRNFRITRDENLQRRPGTKTMMTLGIDPVRGMWSGFVEGEHVFLAACGGRLWKLEFSADYLSNTATELGEIDTSESVHFFGFSDIVYILNGLEYKQFDGTTLSDVGGYRPLVAISVTPDGGGETLEQVNKLVGTRRCWISPDGEGATFKLPEDGLLSVDYVKSLLTGENLPTADYSYDLVSGSVTFNTAPAQSVNSYEIGWTMEQTYRHQVAAMRYSELYSGAQDTRVFLYGDGTNKAIYSGLDYDGEPRADYFPDQNEVAVGDENTPITGMIRHYSSLACFKSDSAWSITYGLTTLADGLQIPAFYVIPTNRIIGSSAMGQVRLVLNAPYTVHGGNLYEWRNNSSYSSNLSTDERQAKRISDRIFSTLKGFDMSECFCWDDNGAQEYYICHDDKALVLNYAADAWYYYDSFDVSCMCNHGSDLFIGSSDGRIKRFAYEYLNDDGEAIEAYWESGSMSFGQDYMRKYSAQMWVGIKPETNAEITVTVQTDRKSSYSEKVVSSSLFDFGHINFARWSFEVNRKPHMERLKIKAKKFVFYKLVFETEAVDATAIVLAADIRVRYTGYAK